MSGSRTVQPIRQSDTAFASGAVSVLTTSTVVAVNNPARAEINVVNDGVNVVYLAFATANASDGTPTAPTAVANSGIRLNPAGGSWSSTAYSGPVAAIAVTGTTAVTVAEF